MRKGFTLIELLVVVFVVSFITISALNSYNLSDERIDIQAEISKLQGMINNMRSASLNESAVDAPHIALFSTVDNEAYSFIDISDQSEYQYDINDSPKIEIIDLDLGDSDLIDIKEFYILNKSGWNSTPKFGNLALIFNPPYAECSFAIDGIINENQSMVKIPIFASGALTPNRYLYFHKKSCLAEVLTDNIE